MDWEKMKEEYLATGISLHALGRKYGVAYSTVRSRAVREHWGAQRPDPPEENRVHAAADQLLEKIMQAISIATAQEILEDRKNLRALTGALMDIKNIKDMKTAADESEQAARIAKLRRDLTDRDTETEQITVKILGGEEAWKE